MQTTTHDSAHLLACDSVAIREEADILTARRQVREAAIRLGFGNLGMTRVVTAASELARNTLIHGGGGKMQLSTWAKQASQGIELLFEDQGKGIADIEQAMTDGFTTGSGMGLGLSGSKRLMDEFEIASSPGQGTRVKVAIWS